MTFEKLTQIIPLENSLASTSETNASSNNYETMICLGKKLI